MACDVTKATATGEIIVKKVRKRVREEEPPLAY